MTHTKGPWEVVRLSSISGPFSIRMDYDGQRKFYGAQMVAREADAHLISAAPDLLEALKELLPQLDLPNDMWWCPVCKKAVSGYEVTYQEYHETCGAYLSDVNHRDFWKEALAAIRKASNV